MDQRNLGRKFLQPDLRPQSERTKNKIVDAAMHLFSCNGIEAVSLREIAASAGQKNTNVVKYHFRDKDGLIEYIFNSHMNKFEPLRERMIEISRSDNRLSEVKTLLEILLLPYLTIIDDHGLHCYAGFMSQYMLRARITDTTVIESEKSETPPNLSYVLNLLKKEIAFLSDDLFWLRLRTAIRSFTASIVRWDRERQLGMSKISLETLIIDTIYQVKSGLVCATGYDNIDSRLLREVIDEGE